MAINSDDYPDGQPSIDVKLAAMGYKGAHRGGGIDRPRMETLPANAVLLRLFKPMEKGDLHSSEFGGWWFTPFEYRRVCAYFGVDGRALVPGRAQGKSAMHGVFAVLSEWSNGSALQMSRVNAVRLKEPMLICYGPGAPANADGYARTVKPALLTGNTPARQVYIHKCWEYQAAMHPIFSEPMHTDAVFGTEAGPPPVIAQAPALAFEK